MSQIELTLLTTTALATLLGGLALGLVHFRWRWLGRHYQEFWVKVIVACFRFLRVTATVVRSATAPPGAAGFQQPFVQTLLLGGLGYLLWELAGAYADHRHKQTLSRQADDNRADLESAQAEAAQARSERGEAIAGSNKLVWLLSALLESSNIKRQRIHRANTFRNDTSVTVPQVRDGLRPLEQVDVLLEQLATLLRLLSLQDDPNRTGQNFRIALVIESSQQLVPLAAFDLATRSHEPFVSYTRHAESFRLDNETNPSLAVQCLRTGRALIVADCESEAGFYFHDRQPNYLKSMIAYPIEDFRPDGINKSTAALIIDTNVTNFFRETGRRTFELMLNEFASRLALEYALAGLIGVTPNLLERP